MSAKAEKTEAKPGGKKKMLPLIIGIVVVLVAMLVGKSVLGGGKGKDKAKAEKKAAAEVGISLPLDEFLVNLSGGGDHYLRTTLSLGLKKGITEEQAKEHVASMRDAILTVLSTKSIKDLSNAKGREDLKEEMLKKINEATGEENVVKVYLTAFATQ